MDKESVKEFWDEAACGEDLLLPSYDLEGYAAQASERYRLEPYIIPFANFEKSSDLAVLEIGLGLGADHESFALAGAKLTGIDLTPRAVQITGHRLELKSLETDLLVGDAEDLPYDTGTFDFVFSWGVIHHSPNTRQAAKEILRVLKPGGEFRVMVYHTWSLVGLMLWVRYGLLRGRPWVGLEEIYSKWLESPGTKSYTTAEAASLFDGATDVVCRVELTHGDLLESGAGQRHEGRGHLIWCGASGRDGYYGGWLSRLACFCWLVGGSWCNSERHIPFASFWASFNNRKTFPRRFFRAEMKPHYRDLCST